MPVIKIIKLQNHDILEIDSDILIYGSRGFVIPKNAFIMFPEDTAFRVPNGIPHIEINGKEYKWCFGCKKWLRLIEFYKHKSKHDKYSGRCVECASKMTKAWYIKNRLKISARRKSHREGGK